MARILDQLIGQASKLTDCPAWSALTNLASDPNRLPLRELLDRPGRFREYSLETGELLVDFSRQSVTDEIMAALLELAGQRRLDDWVEQLFVGSDVNNTERRPALHMALREPCGGSTHVGAHDAVAAAKTELERVMAFAGEVRAGKYRGVDDDAITDVVNIGTGGSDLGLVMADAALRHHQDGRIRAHFVSNIDGSQLNDVLAAVKPHTTLFVVCSKSFTTEETLLNATAARAWLTSRLSPEAVARHFVAVSVNDAAMDRFGISPLHRFRLWDWVGGRYSLWSAVGLALAIVLGATKFRELLSGAAEMDDHFRTTPWPENLPVVLGLLGVWNQNFLGTVSHAILPYDQRLQHFPAFLQQLEMESNGKSVTRDGIDVTGTTGTIVWGQPGSNAQHSFFQLLHQGTSATSLDFIAPAQPSSPNADMHQRGLANMLAQAEAFARGYDAQDPHKTHTGDRVSTIILLNALSPKSLGMLVALYEHKVFVQSVIWGINPFDQWGVELGKKMAAELAQRLAADESDDTLPGIAEVLKRWREA